MILWWKSILLGIIVAIMLVGCGGGDSSGSSSSRNTTTIKKTGQTKSYDTNGNLITDGSLKDDGYYQKGVTPSYTRDDAKQIVTDNITKLQWQDNEEAKTVTKTWQDAKTYCANLTLGGYTDWRLPTAKELGSIVDYGKSYTAIDTTYFKNVSSGNYWSSTTYKYIKCYAWVVYFNSGYTNHRYKGNNYYVRCVRDGE